MFICPAATARLLTDRLAVQVRLSALIAAVTAIVGYALAAWVPLWLGSDHALAVSGMIAVVSGAGLALAVVVAPRRGRTRQRPAAAAPAPA
jgi:manganese/zinc/iron transport system permease protein